MDIDKLKISVGRSGYTVEQLKSFCRHLSLNVSDNKQILVDRILLSLDNNLKSSSMNVNDKSGIIKSLTNERKEHQGHGFNYETIFSKITGCQLIKDYSSQFDGYLATDQGNIPVQIKTVKMGCEICLGDYYRNLNIKENFILHIAQWKLTNDVKTIVEFFTLYIDKDKWIQHFTYTQSKSMNVEFQLITNLHQDDDNFHQLVTKHKKQFDEENPNSIIKIRFKRDHQKRIQCSIPQKNIVMLKRNFPSMLFNETIRKQLIGIIISNDIIPNESSNVQLDQFYTIPEVVKDICFKIIDILTKCSLIIEPSAGNGIFMEIIRDIINDDKIIGYDIKPDYSLEENIIQQDFLSPSFQKELISKTKDENEILIIDNPPFGNNGSLAINFFNTCSHIPNVKYIGFILPLSFEKQSMKDRLDLNFSLEQSFILPVNSFYHHGIIKNIPTCFQLWKRISKRRDKLQTIEPIGYQFIKYDDCNNQEWDFEIVRVGGRTSTAFIKNESPMAKYNYFIKLDNHDKYQLIVDGINNCLLFKNIITKTIGPKSLSKKELIPILNQIIIDIK